MDDQQLGLSITAVAAGIDTYERRASGGTGIIEDEGLVPLYLGRDLVEERSYDNWEQIRAETEEIGSVVNATADGPRKLFLCKLVESLRMATLLFSGGDAPFDEKLARHVGVPAESIPADFIDGLADRLDKLLTEAGFVSGPLTNRILEWEGGFAIPPADLEGVFTKLMAEAQGLTDDLVVPTDGYTMELNPVRGVIYSARCNFVEGKMDLNVDNSFTLTGLKHLVAHECFPGHSTQAIYTLKAFKEGRATADVLLCSLNGITGVLQEGIGDQGIHLIGWINDINDEIAGTLIRYRSAAATQCAWRMNMEGLSAEAAYGYLQDVAAMQEARIRGRIDMANHPFRGPFIASYFYGNEAVQRVRLAVEDDLERRATFIKELYGRMHSPESLCAALGVEYQPYGDI